MSKPVKWLMGVAGALVMLISVRGAAGAAQTVSDLQAQIDALLMRLQAPFNAQPVVCAVPAPSLTIGSQSIEVKKLQIWLNGNGYPVAASGVGSTGNEVTYFGALTRAAVARFQSANGIRPATGFYGPITMSAVRQRCLVTSGSDLGFAVRANTNSPQGEAVARGSTRLPVFAFDLVGTSTLRSLTLHHYGEGPTSGFTRVYLYDGEVRLTTDRQIDETTGNVVFDAINLPVAGQKTITVIADVSGSNSANKDGFEIVSASSLKADGPISGSFPLRGSLFARLDVSVGSLTVQKNALAIADPTIGASGVKIASFRMTSGMREDIVLHRITLKSSGSMNSSLISSFILKQGGITIATASALNSRGQLILTLASPLTIPKGTVATFELYADIAATAHIGDTVRFYLENSVDVDASGATSGWGVNVIATAYNNSAQNGTDASWVSVIGGAVTVMFEGPSVLHYAVGQNDIELMRLNIAARDAIEINRMRFMLTGGGPGANNDLLTPGGLCNLAAANYTDIKLTDVMSGLVLARIADGGCGVGEQDTNRSLIFTDLWRIAAGTSRTVKLTADIAKFQPAVGETVKATLVAFRDGDIQDLDTALFVPASQIIPAGNVTGATHSIYVSPLAAASASIEERTN